MNKKEKNNFFYSKRLLYCDRDLLFRLDTFSAI